MTRSQLTMTSSQAIKDYPYSPDVLLDGYFGAGNLGDDINMLVSFYLLSKIVDKESLYVSTVTYAPYVKSMLGNIKCIMRGRLAPPSVKLNVIGGGGLFYDYGKFEMNFDKLPFGNAASEFVKKFKLGERKNIATGNIAFGLGIGPFTPDSIVEKQAADYLADFDLIGVRD